MAKLILIAYVLATSLGLVILKLGTASGLPISFVENKLRLNLNLYTISGVFLYGVSFLLYLYLISKNELGYIIPLTTALVYVLIFFASFVVFKESFSIAKIFAIMLILTGILILSIKK